MPVVSKMLSCQAVQKVDTSHQTLILLTLIIAQNGISAYQFAYHLPEITTMRERETDSQTDRKTDRQRETETDRERERESERERQR